MWPHTGKFWQVVRSEGVALANSIQLIDKLKVSRNVAFVWKKAGIDMRRVFGLIFALIFAGCAHQSSMMLDANTAQISTSAAPVCGVAGAQRVAATNAAIETIRQGFDKYTIEGGQASSDVRIAGYTPKQYVTNENGNVTLNRTRNGYVGNYSGVASTQSYGGYPIIMGHNNQSLIVRMFKAGDPKGENAVEAKAALGPNWGKIVAAGPKSTCLN